MALVIAILFRNEQLKASKVRKKKHRNRDETSSYRLETTLTVINILNSCYRVSSLRETRSFVNVCAIILL